MSLDLSTCRIPSTDSELDALIKEHLADKAPITWDWLGECAVRELARRAGAVPPVEVAPRLALAVLAEYHHGSGVQHPESIKVLEKAYADACGRHIKAGLRLSKAQTKAGTAYCPTAEIAERLAKAVESAKSAAQQAARERDSAMDALNAAAAEWERAFQDRADFHPAKIR